MGKKILLFVTGMITGALLFWGASILIPRFSDNTINEISTFDEPGQAFEVAGFQVFQTLPPNYAFARSIDDFDKYKILNFLDIQTGLDVLLYDPQKNSFYDNQVLKIEEGSSARQVGVYRYTAKDGNVKTVPVVQIFKKE